MNRYGWLVKAGLTVAALAALVAFVEPGAIVAALRGAAWTGLAAALALMPVNLLLDGVVWRVYLRAVLPPSAPPQVLGLRRVMGAVLCGFALGFFTPARVGEYAGRAVYLGAGDRWTLAATIFVQRMVDMAVAVTAGLAALAWAMATGLLPRSAAWLALAGVGAAVGLGLTALVLRPGRAAVLLDAATRRATAAFPSAHPASEAVRSRVAFLRRLGARQAARAWALSVLRYGIFVAQFVLVICAFDVQPACWKAALGVALVFFAKFLIPSVTLMDLGVREGASVYFLGLLGMADAVAFNAALVLFAINLVVPSALGVPTLLSLDIAPPPSPGDPPAPETFSAREHAGASEANGVAGEAGSSEEATAPSSPSSDAAALRA